MQSCFKIIPRQNKSLSRTASRFTSDVPGYISQVSFKRFNGSHTRGEDRVGRCHGSVCLSFFSWFAQKFLDFPEACLRHCRAHRCRQVCVRMQVKKILWGIYTAQPTLPLVWRRSNWIPLQSHHCAARHQLSLFPLTGLGRFSRKEPHRLSYACTQPGGSPLRPGGGSLRGGCRDHLARTPLCQCVVSEHAAQWI